MTLALTPWQSRAYEALRSGHDEGLAGHAMLMTGPVGIGKRAVADALAAYMLCAQPSNGAACGSCRACQLRLAGTHPDLRIVTFELNKEGTKLRTEIVIDQLREVSASLALTPQMGGAQIVIIDPADRINRSAANALLKTLEEPLPNRYLWLLATHRSHLPQTIRSRCQSFEMPLPRHEEGLAWLREAGRSGGDAEAALRAARGHPPLALAWLEGGGLQLRQRVEADLEALAAIKRLPTEVAEDWVEADPDVCLRFAADIVVDRAAASAPSVAAQQMAAWFDEVNRTRALLRTPVKPSLLLTELLVDWCRKMVPLNKERRP